MELEKLFVPDNPVLQVVPKLFTPQQLQGQPDVIGNFPAPWQQNAAIFDKRMADVGWIRAQAWSTWVMEVIYTHAAAPFPKHAKTMQSIFTGSATDTYRRFCINLTCTKTKLPVPGAIAFYQWGSSWMGHAALVLQTKSRNRFCTLEGVCGHHQKMADKLYLTTKHRSVSTTHQPYGLNLLGFIIPPFL